MADDTDKNSEHHLLFHSCQNGERHYFTWGVHNQTADQRLEFELLIRVYSVPKMKGRHSWNFRIGHIHKEPDGNMESWFSVIEPPRTLYQSLIGKVPSLKKLKRRFSE